MLAVEILALAGAALAFSIAASLLVARGIGRPIAELTRAAESLANGNSDARIPRCDIEEVRILSDAMRAMSDELRKRISSLHKRNCELDEIFAHMGGAVFICASDGSILRMNKAAADLFGLPARRRKAENRRVDAQHKPHRRRGQDVFRKGARQLRDRARLRKDSGAFELNTPLRLRQAARAYLPCTT